MKRTTVLYAVAALVTLSFAGQAFARGGSMGGGQGYGSMGGTHQMASTMQPGSGNGMQQRIMPTNGSGPQAKKQGGSGGSVGHRNGQGIGNGAGPTRQHAPVATAAK